MSRLPILTLVAIVVVAACSGAPPTQTSAPTAIATPTAAAPTDSPSIAPTDVPTRTPTEVPTEVPTGVPTALPTLPTAVAIDPCALATQEEVDAVAGTPLEVGYPGGEPQVYSCTWTGPTTGPLGQIEIYLGENAKKFLDIDRDTLEHEFTQVAGIGDEAWLEENSIFFRKGTTWVALRVVRLNDPVENVEPLTELARRMVDRLP